MMSAKSNDYNATDALVNNHGSAAGPSVQAALPPMAAGIVPSTSQAPLATAMPPGTATGSLGNTGLEYGIAQSHPNHGLPTTRSTLSAGSRGSQLGTEIRSRSRESSDDTLTFSPDLPDGKREARTQDGSKKRPASTTSYPGRVRAGSNKRMASTASPPARLVRKASLSPVAPRRPAAWPSPRDQAPRPTEERMAAMEKAFA